MSRERSPKGFRVTSRDRELSPPSKRLFARQMRGQRVEPLARVEHAPLPVIWVADDTEECGREQPDGDLIVGADLLENGNRQVSWLACPGQGAKRRPGEAA